MKISLFVNGVEIDMLESAIRLSGIETFVTSGQPNMSFFMVTNRMPSPSPVFSESNPWTYNGKTIKVVMSSDDLANSRTIFLGRIKSVEPSYREENLNGYSFSAIGYGSLAETVPIINPLDLSGAITFNPDRNDAINYDSILDGMNLGAAIKFLLGGTDIAKRLVAFGFTGMYASVGTASSESVLNQKVIDELSQITARPLGPISFSGENLFGSIQSVLETYEPNYGLIADPHDLRFKFISFNKTRKKTFTLGVDRIDKFTHRRDVSQAAKRVRIRGGANIRPYLAHFNYGPDTSYPKGFKTGNLIEKFQYGSISSDTAKTVWKLKDFERQVIVKGDSNGVYWPPPGSYKPCDQQVAPYSCIPTTMPAADEIELNAASFATNPETWLGDGVNIAWAKDEWAQTASGVSVARQGRITIKRQFRWNGTETSVLKKGDIMWSVEDRFLVVGNDAYPKQIQKCDGTICTYDKIRFRLDRPHGIDASTTNPPPEITAKPSDYKEEWNFELTGFNPSGAVVWRRYGVNFGTNTQKSTDRGVTRKIMKMFPEPVPWRSSEGLSVTMVSSPQAAIIWSANGLKPFFEWPINFYIDREHNEITFTPPVVRLFGTRSKLETGGFNNSIKPPWDATQVIDGVPVDIRVLLPVADGVLESVYPPESLPVDSVNGEGVHVYGTAARYEGVDSILDVNMPGWVKSVNQATVDSYAAEIYKSVKDTIVHGDFTHIGLHDPWSEAWNFYWPTEESYTDPSDVNVTRTRQLVPSVEILSGGSQACDTDGFGVLPEEEMVIRKVAINFNEGSGGKNATVLATYSNQKSPWVSPQSGFDSFMDDLGMDQRRTMMDFQNYQGPGR